MAIASGKVILLGEHAVVYGVPALAVGIDRGASAEVEAAQAPGFVINRQPPLTRDARDALSALRLELGAPELHVRAELDLPAGAGLGASAALGVAIARAFVEHAALPPTPERVLPAADAWERVFHGNPSGIDVRTAYYGGCLRFQRGQEPEFVELAQPLRLAIGIAGPPASTKSMVDSVAKLQKRRPQLVEKTLEGIRSLVHNAALCLTAGDLQGLGKLMDFNQMLLSGLFLSTPEIEQACGVARDHGALGAKLTGAGGGGAVIALAAEPERIVTAWRDYGIQAFVAECGVAQDRPRTGEPEP